MNNPPSWACLWRWLRRRLGLAAEVAKPHRVSRPRTVYWPDDDLADDDLEAIRPARRRRT